MVRINLRQLRLCRNSSGVRFSPSGFSSLVPVLRSAEVPRSFVPVCQPVPDSDILRLRDFVQFAASRLLVLTGAGLSTASGIPDYRSEGLGLYNRTKNRPMQYQEFLKSSEARQRYWARNYLGWPLFSARKPSRAHWVLSDWESKGLLHWLVTQNVDALHHKAGSRRFTELHGCTHRVHCLRCEYHVSRAELQSAFRELNPGFSAENLQIAPDGDVLLDSETVKRFRVPACPSCGGVLKPDVIFFGDNVPRHIVEFVYAQLAECSAVLVLGSSLQVYSAYRFLLRAKERHLPLAIVNIGDTRADRLTDLRVRGACCEVLDRVQELRTDTRGSSS